jgi:hypothetical protein
VVEVIRGYCWMMVVLAAILRVLHPLETLSDVVDD